MTAASNQSAIRTVSSACAVLTAASLGISTLCGSPLGAQTPVEDWLRMELTSLVDLYRTLHREPEVSFREIKTSKRVAAELAELTDAIVTRNVGGLGVVAILPNGNGPTLLLRADMDALPIGERTGLGYASRLRKELPDGRVEGIMHACGHDVHMTVLIGTARFLADHRDLWRGTLVCVGQPAEERGAGARAMLDDGLLERFPYPDFALACHVSSDLPTGVVGCREGPAMANVDSVDITVFGRGGHGAKPHETIDPIVVAAQLVLQLQTIVARELDPTEPAVVTVGSIHGGTKHNIISDRCHLQLTVRSMTAATRSKIHAAIMRKANAAGAPPPKVEFSEGVPALSNDPKLTARVRRALERALGQDRVTTIPQAMTGEDFAHFGRSGIPSSMLRLGTIAPARLAKYTASNSTPPGLHSAFYFPDAEGSLRTGVRAFVAAALELLSR